MKSLKQLGWLASGTSLMLWSAMGFAQAGGYPQTQPGVPGRVGTVGAPGQPGTAGYPGQAGTMGDPMGTNGTAVARCRITPS